MARLSELCLKCSVAGYATELTLGAIDVGVRGLRSCLKMLAFQFKLFQPVNFKFFGRC